MLSYRSIPNSNIVEFTIDGGITRRDFDAVIAEANSKIEDYGSVSLLEEIRSLDKVPAAVLWEDLGWALGHMGKITRAAVVCDEDWIEKAVALLRPLVSAELRHFDLDQVDEAREWLLNSLD